MNPIEQVTRRQLLKAAGMSLPLFGLGDPAASTSRGRGGRKNVILFMTDQERKIQHFPPNWESENLPGLTRLKQNGLSFERAFTNACMCSPARATWLTGYFPAQHGVKYTLEDDMSERLYPQVQLSQSLANIATVMSAAGYNVVYKGKWHLSKPAGHHWVRSDLGRYGFERWTPQDAGLNQDIDQEGGGSANHDGRFMHGDGNWHAGREGVLAYLNSAAAAQQPFFLIISLINPHDVLLYPKDYIEAGYDESWLEGNIGIPPTVGEDLTTKPTSQRQFLASSQALGPLPTPAMKRNYLNFYGNLMKLADGYLVEVLDTLNTLGMVNDTLVIRTADHGEVGLAHGGLRQKNFNFYEETIRVPLVFSNPELYPEPRQSQALVSHVDFLPTIASLFGAPMTARSAWQGIDYSSLVIDPSAPPVQDHIVFTYDDYQYAQANGPYPTPPNHIVSIREERYKLAEYYDADGVVPSQWEMYDLLLDPLETRNLGFAGYQRTPEEQAQFERLSQKLAWVKSSRLQSLD